MVCTLLTAPSYQGASARVEHVDIFVAGFIYKTYNKLRGAPAPKAAGCLQRGEEKTGESFRNIAGYIEKHKPRAFHLGERQRNPRPRTSATRSGLASLRLCVCVVPLLSFLRPYLALAFRRCR